MPSAVIVPTHLRECLAVGPVGSRGIPGHTQRGALGFLDALAFSAHWKALDKKLKVGNE